MVLSKDSEKCKQCELYNECNNKRMELCGYLIPSSVESSIQPLAQDMMVKHAYRDVKIAENTTVTVDIEELTKKIEDEIYKNFGCSFLREG